MHLDDLREQLVSKAYLFEDPGAYEAGVSDALDALRIAARWQDVLSDVPDSAVLTRQFVRPALSRSVRRRNARAG
jgi:hypothetical protein